MKSRNLHDKALFGFGSAAEAYEASRPSYPKDALNYLRNTLDLRKGRTVVDLAAGTGKFTRLLVETGVTVSAIEPIEAMRERLKAALPGVTTFDGTAEAMPVPDETADVITVAQAFHWFKPDAALAEIHRVLRKGGKLALIWNFRDQTVDWVAALEAILTQYEGDTPRFESMKWREAFNKTRLFSTLEASQFPSSQLLSPQMLLTRVDSISFIATLPEHVHQQVRNEVSQLIADHPQTRGQTEIRLPYQTHTYVCSKL